MTKCNSGAIAHVISLASVCCNGFRVTVSAGRGAKVDPPSGGRAEDFSGCEDGLQRGQVRRRRRGGEDNSAA